MEPKTNFKPIILLAIFACILIVPSCTTNWPQFRGPENNMVATGKNMPTKWGNENNIRWTSDLNGTGWSSPIIWGNKVFVSTAVLEKKATVSNSDAPAGDSIRQEDMFLNDIYQFELSCIDLKTGKEIWKQQAKKGNPRVKTHAGNTYASETPVTDGKRVYAYFGMTGLFCFDLNGRLLWETDLGAYETLNGWGTGSSPVVYQDLLYVQIDNEVNSFLVALDAKTGEEKWKAERNEKTNYSTPIIWENSVRTELITSGKTARSYDPVTGDLLWKMKMDGGFDIPSPVANKDHLYIGNAGGPGGIGNLFSVKAGAEGDISLSDGELSNAWIEWSLPEAGTSNPSPLLYDGYIYLLSNRGGILSCFEAATGRFIYKEEIAKVAACWATPWAHNNKIYFMDEKGVTHIVQAGERFEVLGQNKLDDKFWSSVAITNDAYIFKGAERLYCVQNP